MSTRSLQRIIRSIPASDGAGVKLGRSLGQSPFHRVDPFLMLDEISSDSPDDYLAGFPAHPHRGFETVTYLLEGHMLHEDHLGNRGDLRSGGVQWMTAGRGIIHSEMPQQEDGRLHGFQLWINLPAVEKMKAAAYRDIQPNEIPHIELAQGGTAKVIAGTLEIAGKVIHGAMQGLSTAPLFFDVRLPANGIFSHPVTATLSAFLYPYEGALTIGTPDIALPLQAHEAGVLSSGEQIEVRAGADGAGFLLLAAHPLGEPVVQYGPFVMNTKTEIEQAIQDYESGELV
ncbi:MAG: pirin family protein [Sulfuricella denitrificans]|nr:pirin family protein [Sulfuricella denitrificans]